MCVHMYVSVCACVVCCACHCRQRGDKAASFCLHTKGPKTDFTNESQTEHRLVLAKATHATLRTQGQLKRRTAGSRVGPHVDIICLLSPRCHGAHTQQTGVKFAAACGMRHVGAASASLFLALWQLSVLGPLLLLKHINFKYYFGSLFLSRLINEICNVFVRVLFVSFDKLIAISLRHVSIIYFDNNNNV